MTSPGLVNCNIGENLIMGRVIAICISEKRGTQKHSVQEAEFIEEWGIKNDAHAGKWHRQVSLLEFNKIDEFRKNARYNRTRERRPDIL